MVNWLTRYPELTTKVPLTRLDPTSVEPSRARSVMAPAFWKFGPSTTLPPECRRPGMMLVRRLSVVPLNRLKPAPEAVPPAS